MKATLSEMLKIPAFSEWHLFEGGTFAAPGKKGYSFTAPGLSEKNSKIHWDVSPVSYKNGRHKGYSLTVFGLPGSTGYQWIYPTGSRSYIGSLPFRDPRSAVAVARRVHYEEVSKALCEALGVPQKTIEHMLREETKSAAQEITSPSIR